MTPSRRRFWLSLTSVVALVTCVALFLAFKPRDLRLPGCMFHRATGLYCPGCGTTRALRKALSGDILGAFRYNPATIPGLAFVAYLYALDLFDLWRGETTSRRSSVILGYIAFYLLLAFMILRNIPCACFDCLRPLDTF